MRQWRWLVGYFLLVLVSVARAASGPADEQPDLRFAHRYFDRVSSGDAIPGGVVTALARAPNGLLWLGTQEGLLRFDGYLYKHYRFDPQRAESLPGDFITALRFARDGTLWIGTINDGLARFDQARERFQVLRPSSTGLRSAHVTAFAEGKHGMWVGSANGLYLLDRELKIIQQHFEADAGDNFVRSLLVDKQNTLWIGSNQSLRRWRAEQSTTEAIHSDATEAFAGQVVQALLQTNDQRLWIGTRQGGLARMHTDGSDLQRMQAGDEQLLGQRVQAIAQASNGDVWVAGTTGLHVVDGAQMRLIDRYTLDRGTLGSLAYDAIGALAIDPQDWLWIGTWGEGLQKTNANRALVQTIRSTRSAVKARGDGLAFLDVHATLELADGRLLFGTGGGGLELFDRTRGRIKVFGSQANESGLHDSVVIALRQASDRMIWIGTQRGGLYRAELTDDVLRAERLGPARTVSDVLLAHNGDVWFGTSAGLSRISLAALQAKQWDGELMLDGDSKPILGQIHPMLQTATGDVWVGSANGLHQFDGKGERLRSIYHDPNNTNSLSHNSICGLLAHRDGSLWIASERGIDRLQVGAELKIERVSARLGRVGNVGANLQQDKHGRVWTEQVVIDLRARKLTEFGRADGLDLGTTWTGSSTQLRDGRVLHGGTQGVAVVDVDRYQVNQYTPETVATALRVNGKAIPLAALQPALSLQPNERSFAVEFSALDYASPIANRYRYRLLGFDDNWIEAASDTRIASYSNLWPGRYTLEIAGSSRIGRFPAKPLQLTVDVQPAWWQRSSTHLVGIVCALAAMFAGLRWRTHQLHLRSELLDKKVRQRTLELAESNQELRASNEALAIAQKHLLSAQEELVQQEKMASLGRLVAGVAHEVNTPLGIAITASSHLQEQTQQLQKRLESGLKRSDLEAFTADANTASELLFTHLQRAAELVRKFKQVSVDRHQNDMREAPLRTLLDENLASLQPLWKHRGVDVVLQSAPDSAVMVNAGALSQILNNLVQNALLHAFPDDAGGRIEISAAIGNQYAEIHVRDNGIGMDSETLSRIFEPFFTTARHRGGTGLGLHIAFNLATSMGGNLYAQSKVGQGTHFVLRFPARA